MKMTFKLMLFYLCFVPFGTSAQNSIDSLTETRNKLIENKTDIELKIEGVEKEIISEILKNGFEMTLKSTYKGQTFDLKESGIGGNTIATLKEGDKVIVFGKESIYFKAKFGELEGLIFISTPEYPISLLGDYKYKDHVEGRSQKSGSTKSKSTGSNCSSTQCSGHTQKGSRCRNMTTNCSGRCHLH